MKRYYLDTAIWIDYYENRADRFRPLGEWALALLKKISEKKEAILFSDVIYGEMFVFGYTEEEIENLLHPWTDLIQKITPTRQEIAEAIMESKKRKLPYGDCLHAILSRDHDALLIARDHHFESLIDIKKCQKPEELI